MAILLFTAKLIISCSLLYGYYHLFLRNKRFHRYNRFYLLAIALVSFVIPFVHIPVNLFWGSQQHAALIQTLKVINANGWEEPVTVYARQNQWSKWLNIQSGLYVVYTAGVLTGLIILIRSLAYINTLRRKYMYEIIDRLKIYQTREPGTPFSFFRSIFWDKKIDLNNPPGQQIFRHELFHVKEKHSADILLMEILCCIAWFNPFFHLIKKEIRAIHEFLADEYAVSANNRYDYAELLVSHAITQKTQGLTHPFFYNQIKRRITMITQSNPVRRSGYISRIMALPLFFVLASAFTVKLTSKPLPGSSAHYAGKNMTVVIDAGHGGIYPGSNSETGMLEKDINLNIAKKIKELAPRFNINVILTRNSDQAVGNAATLKEDLLNRVKITQEANADLFISIHVNAGPDKTTSSSGFEAAISRTKDDLKSRQLASTILTGLKDIYTVNDTIQQRQVGIVVLDKNTCPAVLLECGYINNTKDAAFINSAANQEKIAGKILEGIVQYQLQDNTAKETVQEEKRFIADTAITTGAAAKEKIMAAAKKQLEKSIAESENGKDFPTVDNKNNISVISSKELKETRQSEPIFTKVEFEADYPGGQAGWIKYLTQHLHYPDMAIKKNIQGTVLMQFIVNTDGTITDVKAISGPELLKAESIRAIKQSGVWVPAKQNGVKVRAYKRQPITYKISA